MPNTTKRAWVSLAGLLGCLLAAMDVQAVTRGIWVTRYDFKSASDVASIVENARNLGAKQVYFQVRGNATVCYPSQIEPWAWELTGTTSQNIGVDPGWDPLAVVLAEAKKQGIELHAWLNVFPGWRGVDPAPRGFQHPWVTHRSWFMIDQRGDLLRPTKTFYAFLSPGNPQVRSHLASVFGELARNYPQLDGIHLDYIRYPARNETGNFRDYSYDEESVKAYRSQYKTNPSYDQPQWQRFKCEQVNATIRAIQKAVRAASPSIRLSATCSDTIHSATNEKGQDPRDWLQDNLVDFILPMVYVRSTGDLTARLNAWDRFFDPQSKKRMVIGLNVDFNNTGEIIRQMQTIQKDNYGGVALFAYSSLFTNKKPNSKAETVRSLWHEDILQDILNRKVPRESR